MPLSLDMPSLVPSSTFRLCPRSPSRHPSTCYATEEPDRWSLHTHRFQESGRADSTIANLLEECYISTLVPSSTTLAGGMRK